VRAALATGGARLLDYRVETQGLRWDQPEPAGGVHG
jgi:hypothetical protein